MIRGLINDMQQARVDVVTLGEHFIEFHRAENGTNVGHGQVDDRQFGLLTS